MILTGKKLQEFGQAIHGPIWISMFARRLKRTKRTIMRWRDDNPPPDMRRALLDLTETQIAVLGDIRTQLLEGFDDAP